MKYKAARPAVATWYAADSYFGTIKSVPIVSFTEKTVTYLEPFGRFSDHPIAIEHRMDRTSRDNGYFPTFDEAKEWLMAALQTRFESYELQVLRQADKLRKAALLTPEKLSE